MLWCVDINIDIIVACCCCIVVLHFFFFLLIFFVCFIAKKIAIMLPDLWQSKHMCKGHRSRLLSLFAGFAIKTTTTTMITTA